MTRDEIAALLIGELNRQARMDGQHAPYVSDEFGLSEVVVDGDVDVLAMADLIYAQVVTR